MPAFRLLPVVLFATASLLLLKTAGILGGSGYTLGGLQPARAQQATANEPASAPDKATARAPDGTKSWEEMLGDPEVTGSVAGAKPADPAPPASPKPAAAEPPKKQNAQAPNAGPVPLDLGRSGIPAGERAVLERLQERRQELENRARELDVREGLLKAAEKRVEARIAELKELEAQVASSMQKKDEAEAARFKGLVTMYENMKAKEAARVFDRLEMRVLLDVASQINPRRMSDILAQMAPEAAERLTVELAGRASNTQKPVSANDLPKIEGKPRS